MPQPDQILCHFIAFLKIIHRYGSQGCTRHPHRTDGTEYAGNLHLTDLFLTLRKTSSQKHQPTQSFFFSHTNRHIPLIFLFVYILQDTAVTLLFALPFQNSYQFTEKGIADTFDKHRDSFCIISFQISGTVIRHIVGFLNGF